MCYDLGHYFTVDEAAVALLLVDKDGVRKFKLTC